MTTNERFDDRLASWLRDDSQFRIPDHLDEVLVRTVATRQRPAWSSLERWLPMSTTTRGRVTVAPALLWLLLTAALVAALLGGAILSGAVRLPMDGLGPLLATNGRIFVIDGSTLKSFAADGTDPQVAVTTPADASAMSTSPDGRFVAYILDTIPRLDVLDIESGTTATVELDGAVGIGGPVTWSPDGSRILFNTFDGSFEHLVTARPDGTDVREITFDTDGVAGPAARIGEAHVELSPAGWSPTGDRVAFVAVDPPDSGQGSLYLVRPDGSDVQQIGPTTVEAYSVSWSPDPSVERLAFSVMQPAGLAVQLLDVATGAVTDVGPGFWPTWSPDGSRLSYWHDGTVVVDTAAALAGTAEPLHVTPTFTTSCPQHTDLAEQSYCGPASWSPDGQRLLALDIVGGSVVSVLADGSGDPIVIPLDTPSALQPSVAAWQPIRP